MSDPKEADRNMSPLFISSDPSVSPDPEMSKAAVAEQDEGSQGSYKEIVKKFAFMGWFAFGGPAAHIGLFEKVFVEKEKWLSHHTFAELLALGQCLPGPTSTQVSFAIGVTQKGIPGGLLSGALFQYPGLLMMSLAGLGAAEVLIDPADWLRGLSAGLSAGGVALVVDACIGLCKKICVDDDTMGLCLVSACVAFYCSAHATAFTAWILPLLLLIGGCTTRYTRRNKELPPADEKHVSTFGLSFTSGCLLIGFWAAILLLVIVARDQTTYDDWKYLHIFETFFRIGSIIFGGGQVVLPLLQNEVEDWITDEQFYAGLGLVQAMPGPLFNLSAYLGAIAGGVAGIPVAWLGLFGPGVMLIFGVLPVWGWFRNFRTYKLALPGLNSSAVGLVVAACFGMAIKVWKISPFPSATVVIGMITFSAVHLYKQQAPLTIAGGGILGIIAWAVGVF